jgi:hypothetical protein
MNETMTKEIKDAIKKNLPSEVGENLKEILEEHKQLKKENGRYKSENETLTKLNTSLIKERDELEVKLQEANIIISSWDNRENELIKRENKSEILEVELREQQNRNRDLFTIMDKMVTTRKVISYNKNEFGNKPVVMEDNGYKRVESHHYDKNVTETIEEE